jgi:hypothetical protein
VYEVYGSETQISTQPRFERREILITEPVSGVRFSGALDRDSAGRKKGILSIFDLISQSHAAKSFHIP